MNGLATLALALPEAPRPCEPGWAPRPWPLFSLCVCVFSSLPPSGLTRFLCPYYVQAHVKAAPLSRMLVLQWRRQTRKQVSTRKPVGGPRALTAPGKSPCSPQTFLKKTWIH